MTTHSTAPRSPHGATRHLTDYLRILHKRRWIALPAFLIVFVSGVVSSLSTMPVYEATAQLMIEKEARRATSITGVLDDQNAWMDDDFYPTQYKILQSRALALRTADSLEKTGIVEHVPAGHHLSLSPGALVDRVFALGSVVGSKPPAAAPETAAVDETRAQSGKISGFLGGLSISPVRYSRLVDIKYQSPDPAYAAQAANALAVEYMKQSLEFRRNASLRDNAWLTQQLEEQQRKVAESDIALQQYKETHNALAVDDKSNIVVQKLNTLNGQVNDARLARIDKEAIYQQIERMQSSGQPLDSAPAVLADEIVQRLKTEITEARAEQARLTAQNYGPNSDQQRGQTVKIDSATKQLDIEVKKVVASIQAEYLTAKAKEDALVRELEAQKTEALGLDRKAMEYASLQREADSNRKLYEDLLQRTKETGVTGDYQGTNIQIVDKAEQPQSPILPQTRRDLMFSALSGTFLGILLAFGVEYFDSRLKSPEEIRAHLGVPFLGLIPIVTNKDKESGEAPMLQESVAPAFAESIRALRTAMLFSSAEEGARVVLVTSTGPHEGKTVISSSLAISLAQAGQRTVIVDADMRRPRMHEALGRSQEPGLSNVLVGDTALPDATRVASVNNLWLLSAGHIPPNPAELLGSRKFEMLVGELKRHYDWIVIDAPPVMPVTDAAVLAHLTAGVLFVVGAEMTPRRSAIAAIDQLRGAHAKFFGAVLNRVNVERHAYYYAPYYRKEYRKYYQRSANHF
jgi:capsular exopolysaccharide synthesis family protein